MKSSFLARFTPSLMSAEALEAIFVQREPLAQDIVERIRDSALTKAKHHILLIGPRGIGKTHLVALVYHRIKALPEVEAALRIAWLREEEWGITSFRDLVMRVLRALQGEYGEACLEEKIEAIYKMASADEAERAAVALLKEFVGDKTLLVLMENLDDIFQGLGNEGQQQFRAFLQNHGGTAVFATSQSLFNGVSLRTSPFYGFFNIQHLPTFSLDEATRLLTKVAEHEQDEPLVEFLQTPKGRARVRAVHHLAGGNPRVYLIFSQFLTREALDALVEPFMQMLDDLTPYYQARMAWLSPQQRKIVEFLIENRGAAPVKAIADRTFTTPQTASSQLKTLRDQGYVRSESLGRESYYELREPLMRLAIEVKKHRGQPIRLFIDFLRLWYARHELEEHLAMLIPEAILEREYVEHTLKLMSSDADDPVVIACERDLSDFISKSEIEKALQVTEELIEIRGDAHDYGVAGSILITLGQYEYALMNLEKALEKNPMQAMYWNDKGIALMRLGKLEEGIPAIERATELQEDKALFWSNLAAALLDTGYYKKSIQSSTRAIQLSPEFIPAKYNYGAALFFEEHYEEASIAFEEAYKIDGHPRILMGKAATTAALGQWNAMLESLEKVFPKTENIELDRLGSILFWTKWLIPHLYPREESEDTWSNVLQRLITIYQKNGIAGILKVQLVADISIIEKPSFQEGRINQWKEAWEKAIDREDALQFFRLLDTAICYRETEDRRVLLELPIEERQILEQMLDLEPANEPA